MAKRLWAGDPPKNVPECSLLRAHALRRSIAIAAILILSSQPILAQFARSANSDAEAPQASNSEADAQNNGYDYTRPQNSLTLRLRDREISGSDTRTDRDFGVVQLTGRSWLDQDWELGWLAQTEVLNKITASPDPSNVENAFGLGDSTFQAALIHTLSERWAFGFGARLETPTAQDDLGSGKWQIMPGAAVRYSITEWGADSYFVPFVRYAISFNGNPAKRTISEPQIAPTLNISLPERWFLTLYPSNDIRINYGDPISGQTGRLFLPADFAIGRNLNDKVLLSLEIGVPIIKDYPVYDFKTELRMVIKY